MTQIAHDFVRVLVADDSAFMRTALTRMIESDKRLTVVGTAQHGLDALEQIRLLNPDVVTLDIEMPRLDGLATLRRIMAECPRPVLMISSLTQQGAEATVEALEHGAFDCLPKPTSFVSLDIVKIRERLIETVLAAAAHAKSPFRRIPSPPRPSVGRAHSKVARVIAIGASTGGPRALREVLEPLPADLRVPIIVVQHMPPGFTGPFANRLDQHCQISVKEATADSQLEPGTVLIAPAGMHLRLQMHAGGRCGVRLSSQREGYPHVPSVDAMMESVAEVFGSAAMGVILTGMGNDGEAGMTAIHRAGGYTVGQDEASCVVYGMPRACALRGILMRQLPLDHVAAEIVYAANRDDSRPMAGHHRLDHARRL